MLRLILRIVLSFVIYNITLFVTRSLVNAAAFLLVKGGSPELWIFLHQHLLGKSIAIGFLAGLIPIEFLFSVSGFFRSNFSQYLRGLDLEKMKRWIIVLTSPVAIVALGMWISDWFTLRSNLTSVLTEGPSLPISRMFEGFFSASCGNVSDIRLELWGDNFAYRCMVHALELSIICSAAAYSLAPWVRQQLLTRVAIDHPTPLDVRHEEDEMQTSTNEDDEN
jgi:hypothetical protein